MKIKRDSRLYRYLSFFHSPYDMPKTNCQVFRTLFMSGFVLPVFLLFVMFWIIIAMHDFSMTILGMDNWLAWFLVPQTTIFSALSLYCAAQGFEKITTWMHEQQFKPKKKKEKPGPMCSFVEYVD
ncbi:hypothetical protein CPT_Muldoon_084 [Serratia phage Muldoon]|uniref:Uncharacterized protein n=1 Tax=Serratia phage Muldoon TaxID=2601678 RepID=A0A5P8PH88_9CAUD|nr:hypothetical protein HYP94_gp083 [Serratia phage Muldoon]QFR56039.1 hypothetical protein CPT_Muldoon_084 [Serratia phage Muldoon]